MADLRTQIEDCFRGRVCLVGIGNVDMGDDGFGVKLAENLGAGPHMAGATLGCEKAAKEEGCAVTLVQAGTTPESVLGPIADAQFDHVIFLDAVEFGAEPGAVVFLDAGQMASRFPQISTHKLSLGLLAKWLESNGKTRAWVLGVQPQSLGAGQPLTAKVRRTLELLDRMIGEIVERQREQAGSLRHHGEEVAA